MSEKKPPQKYSSLLPPVTSGDKEKPSTATTKTRPSDGKPAQKYESLFAAAESAPPANRGGGPSRQPGSLLTPQEELIAGGASGNDALTSPPSSGALLPSAATGDEPPPYVDDAALAEDDLIEPETLLLAGSEIHSTASADSPPLYKLSYPVGHLRDTILTVSLSRYDYRVRNATSTNGASPRIAGREKHIYDLCRFPDLFTKFPYHLEPISRSGLGLVGLKTHRGLGGSGFRGWRATRASKAAQLQQSEMLYDVKTKRNGLFEWRDGADKSRVLALETSDMGMYRLEIKQTMDRQRRDALAATWCLRVWWEVAAANTVPVRWEDVVRRVYLTNGISLGT